MYVIGQYVECLEKCDTATIDPFEDIEKCPYCDDLDIDTEYELDPIYLAWNPGAARFDRRCHKCGGLWISS